ncbi:MAG: hypothetical protein K8S14_06765 [Actinomycetia bacterium]|nr:hypothetical protein [Actinomycetes bacterium]
MKDGSCARNALEPGISKSTSPASCAKDLDSYGNYAPSATELSIPMSLAMSAGEMGPSTAAGAVVTAGGR